VPHLLQRAQARHEMRAGRRGARLQALGREDAHDGKPGRAGRRAAAARGEVVHAIGKCLRVLAPQHLAALFISAPRPGRGEAHPCKEACCCDEATSAGKCPGDTASSVAPPHGCSRQPVHRPRTRPRSLQVARSATPQQLVTNLLTSAASYTLQAWVAQLVVLLDTTSLESSWCHYALAPPSDWAYATALQRTTPPMQTPYTP
jgi:hypothetical protein